MKKEEKKRVLIMASIDFPSFFKVLPDDSKYTLRIPPLFARTFEQNLPENAMLKIKSGKTWSVKIEKIEESYCFTDGWPKFVKDLELKMGNFLVFWLILDEKSTFKVAIYGFTGCEKELNLASTNFGPIKAEPEANATSGPKGGKKRKSKKIENPGYSVLRPVNSDFSFTKVLSEQHRSRMRLPMKYAKNTGIINKTEVMLHYPNGSSTMAVLKYAMRPRTLDICAGWSNFRKSNRLNFGNTCAFEYIRETDSIRVQRLWKLS